MRALVLIVAVAASACTVMTGECKREVSVRTECTADGTSVVIPGK